MKSKKTILILSPLANNEIFVEGSLDSENEGIVILMEMSSEAEVHAGETPVNVELGVDMGVDMNVCAGFGIDWFKGWMMFVWMDVWVGDGSGEGRGYGGGDVEEGMGEEWERNGRGMVVG